ncbi:adenosylmethionine--8-amino-7-oxononanoate transaminase [Amycolatopsis keratiniphila]|nr:adenosylmethionine--8-amino-7-oxononanoate transaminase [Amycolatopsis keratiniphila]
MTPQIPQSEDGVIGFPAPLGNCSALFVAPDSLHLLSRWDEIMNVVHDWQLRDEKAVWHPYTQHQNWISDNPPVIDSADGVWLTDVSGRRLLDACGSLWVTSYQHGDPRIKAAVADQLDQLDHSSFFGATHTIGIRLAERLIELAPTSTESTERLSKVFYGNDGASMVDAALKMAYQFSVQSGSPREVVLHLENSFHGDSIGASSIMGGDQSRSTYGPLLLKVRKTDSPGPVNGESAPAAAARAIAALESTLAEVGSRCCALIVEPMIQGAGGMRPYHADFLRACRTLADKHGVLLICDEVAAGVARTGRMWATEHAGIVPDIMLCGKGVTGGVLPLSALLATDRVASAFVGSEPSSMFFHGHTYAANPLACAAALESLAIATELDLPSMARQKGDLLGDLLDRVAKHEAVHEVRRLGVMTGIELGTDLPRAGFRVCQAAQERGVWIRSLGDTLVLMPPLAITPEELELMAGVVEESLDDVFAK